MMHNSGVAASRERIATPLLSWPGLTRAPVFQRPFGSITAASGILHRPVEPGDDTEMLFDM
jgi:hypothetical protein